MKHLFALLLLTLLAVPAAAAEGPAVVVDGADFDFGQVFQGEKVDHTFRFMNGGDEPLMIDRVRSSCGCTAALLSAKVVGAGDVAELKATFDSTRFMGPVVKTIYLYSNDPTQQVTELHLRGTVKQELVLSPSRVDLQTLVVGSTKEVSVSLNNQGAKTLDLLSAQATSPELQVELASDQVAAGESVEFTIRATPKAGTSRVSGYVLVQTSSDRIPELRLPVYGVVSPEKK